MGKLTKSELKLHEQAIGILGSASISEDDADFVFDNYHPGATNNLTAGAIFFSPRGVAEEAAVMHGGGGRVIDLCAGIGILGRSLLQHNRSITELVCVEINPEFVEIGKKLVPQARWICGSAFEEIESLGVFDSGISNPPFGNIKTDSKSKFSRVVHLAIAELLLTHARDGAILIIPDGDHSQLDRSNPMPSANYARFIEAYPQAVLDPCSTDIRCYKDQWKAAAPNVAIVNLGFEGASNPYIPQEASASQFKQGVLL